MLNEDLINPKDVLIFKLKHENKRLHEAIDAFKKYDAQRKEYYKFLVNDWQKSDAKHIIEGLKLTIKHQTEQLNNLNIKITVLKEALNWAPEYIDTLLAQYDKINQVRKNNKLTDEVKKLKRSYKEVRDELIYIKSKQQNEQSNNT